MKNNKLILFMSLIYSQQTAFSQIPVQAYCINSEGEISTGHDQHDGASWWPGVLFFDDNTKAFINDVPDRIAWAINSCTALGADQEFDPEALTEFGKWNYETFAGKEDVVWKNLQSFLETKRNNKAFKYLLLYAFQGGKGNLRVATKQEDNSYRYIVLTLDEKEQIITDNAIGTALSVLIDRGMYLDGGRIGQNITDLQKSGIPINPEKVRQQIDSMNQLIVLYNNNKDKFKNWGMHFKDVLSNKDVNASNNTNVYKYTSYAKLTQDIQSIKEFISYNQVGASNVDKAGFEAKIALVDQLDAFFSKLLIAKKSIPSDIEEMNKQSQAMPGQGGGRYAAQYKLVSYVLGDNDAVNVFYNLEAMSTDVQTARNTFQANSAVNNTFLPDLDKKISAFIQEINIINTKRNNFESNLNKSIKKGGKQGDDGIVRQSLDELETAIGKLEKSYNRLQTMFQKANTVQNARFKDILENQRKRLDPNGTLKTTMDGWIAYKNNMRKMVSEAYQNAQAAILKPITNITDPMNSTIATLGTTLEPVVNKLNANQDATAEYLKIQPSIQPLINLLIGSNEKLVKLEPTIQDPNQKNMITTAKNTIATEIANVQRIVSTVTTMAIAAHINSATQIQTSLTAANGEFKQALATYTKNKGPTDGIVKLYNTLLGNVQALLGLLTADLQTLAKMDQKDTFVVQSTQKAKQYTASKVSANSLQYLLYNYGTVPLTKLGIQVQALAVPAPAAPAAPATNTGVMLK